MIAMPSRKDSKVQYLYLTATGRKSGRAREIEIWFVEFDGNYYVLAERFFKAQWVLNILANPSVGVRVGARSFAATARVLDKEKDSKVWKRVQRLAREKYDWGDGLPVELKPESI